MTAGIPPEDAQPAASVRTTPARARRYGLQWLLLPALLLLVTTGIFWREICLWRVDVSLKQRQSAAAASWLARAHWFQRVDDQSRLLELRIARRLNDFDKVQQLLQQSQTWNVPRTEIERERLLAMAQTQQFSALAPHWPELLNAPRDDGPEIAHAYYIWSMLNHRVTEAERTLLLWQQDYPQDAQPWSLLGRYYQSQEKWAAAEDAYRKAVELAPGNDEYLLSLANALRVRLKNDEAQKTFHRFLQRHPDDPVALRGLAQTFANSGDLAQAVEILGQSYQKNPDDFDTQHAYGQQLLSAGRASEAAPVLAKAHQAVPEYANLAYDYARALKASGQVAEAEPLFAFVEESRPALDQLNRLEIQLQSEPQNLDIRMKIAQTTAKYVSRREALRWYSHLLQVAPQHQPALDAVRELRSSLGETDPALPSASPTRQNAEEKITLPENSRPRTPSADNP